MESLRTHLVSLGFSPYEVDIYLALLQEHPANGSQLARRSGVPRSMVYQTLDRLVEKGAVMVAPGEPASYAPVDPVEYFGGLQERYAQSCQALITGLPQVTGSTGADLVWNLTGLGAIRNRALEMYFRSGGQIRTGGDPDLLRSLLRGPEEKASAPAPGWALLVIPHREALLVEVPAHDPPVAAYGRQAALVAAAMAVARESSLRLRQQWTAPVRQFW